LWWVQSKSIAGGVIGATIDIERALKGSLAKGSLVTIQWSSPTRSVPNGPIPGDHGIFFLARTGSGAWQFLPVTVGDIGWRDVYVPTPAKIPAGVAATASADLPVTPSPLDRVLVELTTVLEAGTLLPFDLVPTLRATRSSVLLASFRHLSIKDDPRFAGLGFRGRISMGDPTAIQAVGQRRATLASAPTWNAIVEEIRFYYTSDDPAGIKALGALVTDATTPPDLRVAAASALGRIRSGKLGIQDPGAHRSFGVR
jgi:hypothetical protein